MFHFVSLPRNDLWFSLNSTLACLITSLHPAFYISGAINNYLNSSSAEIFSLAAAEGSKGRAGHSKVAYTSSSFISAHRETAAANNTPIPCACIYVHNLQEENYFLWLKFLFAAIAQKTFLNNSGRSLLFFLIAARPARTNREPTSTRRRFFSFEKRWLRRTSFPYTLHIWRQTFSHVFLVSLDVFSFLRFFFGSLS